MSHYRFCSLTTIGFVANHLLNAEYSFVVNAEMLFNSLWNSHSLQVEVILST
jgi:hypothetical protein